MVLVVVEVLYVVEQFLLLRMFKDSLRGSRSHLKLL